MEKFQSLYNDYWYGRLIQKLRPIEVGYVTQFIQLNQHLGLSEWEMAVNRMFIDKPDKPKRWTLIMEILTVCGKINKSTVTTRP